VHESIGGGGQISVSNSATSSSSSSSSNKDHRVDDTPIEYTSFGGSAQNNNTVKSRAEQMTAHRRVRINLNLFFSLFFWFIQRRKFSETQLSLLFLSEFFFAVTPDRGCFFTASWWFAKRFGRHGRRGSSKGMLYLCSKNKKHLVPKPQNSNIPLFPFFFSSLFFHTCSTRSMTNISDAC
jgi:hypothetical protein